jgi:hypothetical protein
MNKEIKIKGNPKFNGIYGRPSNVIKSPKHPKLPRKKEILRSAIIQGIAENIEGTSLEIISSTEDGMIYSYNNQMPVKVEYKDWQLYGKILTYIGDE